MPHTRKLTPERLESIENERVALVVGVEQRALSFVEPFGLSYEGAPDWLEWDGEYRTMVVVGGGYTPVPKDAIECPDGSVWELAGTFRVMGESDCPFEDGSRSPVTRNQCVLVPDPYRHAKYGPPNPNALRAECPMCEARIGEKHTAIDVGEGYEAVYKRTSALTRR